MTVPNWLRSITINAQFRTHQDDWQLVQILLNERGGTYATPDGEEEGVFTCLAAGNHPEGGSVLVLHWREHKGPFAGFSGIDTLWFQEREEEIKVSGTFFADNSNDYGEIRSYSKKLVEMVG